MIIFNWFVHLLLIIHSFIHQFIDSFSDFTPQQHLKQYIFYSKS